MQTRSRCSTISFKAAVRAVADPIAGRYGTLKAPAGIGTVWTAGQKCLIRTANGEFDALADNEVAVGVVEAGSHLRRSMPDRRRATQEGSHCKIRRWRTDMPGQLFTHYFLTDGIKATTEWETLVAQPEMFAAFRNSVRQQFDDFSLRNSQASKRSRHRTRADSPSPGTARMESTTYRSRAHCSRNEDIPGPCCFLPDARIQGQRRCRGKSAPTDRFRRRDRWSKRANVLVCPFGLSGTRRQHPGQDAAQPDPQIPLDR